MLRQVLVEGLAARLQMPETTDFKAELARATTQSQTYHGEHTDYIAQSIPKRVSLPALTDDEHCPCGHKIRVFHIVYSKADPRKNCLIGMCCVKQFLNNARCCSYCGLAHKRRKTNVCTSCESSEAETTQRNPVLVAEATRRRSRVVTVRALMSLSRACLSAKTARGGAQALKDSAIENLQAARAEIQRIPAPQDPNLVARFREDITAALADVHWVHRPGVCTACDKRDVRAPHTVCYPCKFPNKCSECNSRCGEAYAKCYRCSRPREFM